MSRQGFSSSITTARRINRRAGLHAAVAGDGVAGAFALACGPRDDSGNGAKAQGKGSAPGGQPAAVQGETPRAGGILSQRLATDPPSFDLHQVTTYTGVWPIAPCFNQLVQFHPDEPADEPDGIIADLAERWEQPDLSKELVFAKATSVRNFTVHSSLYTNTQTAAGSTSGCRHRTAEEMK